MRLAVWILPFLVVGGAQYHALAQSAQASQKVDLNTASVQTLETLPGVSAEVAGQIIAHRPYDSFEQFRQKSGLSAWQSDKLAPLVTAQAAAPVRQPQLPPGATPISPESFSRGSSRSPGAGSGPIAGRGITPVPVPSGIVEKIPVPPGTGRISPPSPTQPAGNPRRDALIYGASAVALAIGVTVWMRRTRPTRKTTRDR